MFTVTIDRKNDNERRHYDLNYSDLQVALETIDALYKTEFFYGSAMTGRTEVRICLYDGRKILKNKLLIINNENNL